MNHMERVRKLMFDDGPVTRSDVREELGVDRRAAYAVITGLVRMQHVQKVGSTSASAARGPRVVSVYDLTPQGSRLVKKC